MTEDAYKAALRVLETAVRPVGFFASGLPGGYEALWARDSMIASLGAVLVRDTFRDAVRSSIETLGAHQSGLGQIPNAVGSWNEERKSDITFNTVDSTLWYLIGHKVYAESYLDETLKTAHAEHIKKALLWLRYQDPNEDTLIVQQPTMDWQDAFPHKYGRVLSTQALHYAALRMHGHAERAEHIRRIVNGDNEKYLSLWDEKNSYYLPWIWKDHDGDREQGMWFDTFGNLVAIVTGLASPEIAERILDHIEKNRIHRPFPCRAIDPSMQKGEPEWHSYFEKCDARTSFEYLNGGVWPFIGGFYVAALVKTGQKKKAEEQLAKLAQANKLTHHKGLDWGFHEWLHGKTGKPMGNSNPYQTWSAGMYVYAYECVKRNAVPFFDGDFSGPQPSSIASVRAAL